MAKEWRSAIGYAGGHLFSCSSRSMRFVVCAMDLKAAKEAATMVLRDRFHPNTIDGGLERSSLKVNRRPIKSIGERPVYLAVPGMYEKDGTDLFEH
jgi:hypothetical protein